MIWNDGITGLGTNNRGCGLTPDGPHGVRGYVLYRCRCDDCANAWVKLAKLPANPSRMLRSTESERCIRQSLAFEEKWRRNYYKIPEDELLYLKTGVKNEHFWVIHKPTWTAGVARSDWQLAFCRMTRKDPFMEKWRVEHGGRM